MPPRYCCFAFSLIVLATGCRGTPVPTSVKPGADHHHDHVHDFRHWEIASPDPDRIFLSFHGDAATRRAVTWRTDTSVAKAFVEIAPALAEPGFDQLAKRIPATTEVVDLEATKGPNLNKVHYHSVILTDLEPDRLHAYRVGDGEDRWSEWIQFRTAARTAKPFSFIYFGDAQNDVHSRWSRVIRMAHQTAPQAAFALHAGDLINKANSDTEWAGWFKAGSYLHAQWTGIPVVGNHEYLSSRAAEESQRKMSMLWQPQFTLPIAEGLSEQLHETVYTVEYQDVQIIVLNSMKGISEQARFLEEQLQKPGFNWRCVAFHYPIYSPRFRDKHALTPTEREEWRGIIAKYQVDCVFQGHDHGYLRGQVPVRSVPEPGSDRLETLYVVSVSGPKQGAPEPEHIDKYEAEGFSRIRVAGNTQFFQVIEIDGNQLKYQAYTATGELYDAAVIEKDLSTGSKTIRQMIPDTEERTFENTVEYSSENLL
ncbi:MAG: metallophosphoesterase family protein [Synoicihabitans sp.]